MLDGFYLCVCQIPAAVLEVFRIRFSGFHLPVHHLGPDPFHDPFKNGWTGFKTGDSIAFEACFRKLLVQWRRTPRRPAPCAQVIIDGKYDEPAVLDAAFEEDWGDLSCVSLVAEYDKCETHSVSLDITKEAGNEPFMVMSFIICK